MLSHGYYTHTHTHSHAGTPYISRNSIHSSLKYDDWLSLIFLSNICVILLFLNTVSAIFEGLILTSVSLADPH